ncbi:17332_t:CDS:2 [Acaulospora morrowiae]|uniref:17332_t:CDS:1 n=1 Tax=Acaulospora morrowiae TaxID=94023 RepID=A0A9N9DNE3_9GLOM|nr:17332_t:CDS:2 [Acaulospora morrowiae]
MSLSPASSATYSDADSVYHEDDVLICHWKKCNRQFDDAEAMYSHLSVDHVGRKSTGNLCLDCYWDDCDVRTSKRDHITSHLRVHVPLKPHICEDLKKHYKIHSESHQQQLTSLKNHRTSGRLLARPPTPPYYHPYHTNQYHNNNDNHYANELSRSPIVSRYNSNSSSSSYSNSSSPTSSYGSSPGSSVSSLTTSPISSSINSFPIHSTKTITSPTLNSISFPLPSLRHDPTLMKTNINYQEKTPKFYPNSHIHHQLPSSMPSLVNRDGSSPKSISNERLPSISYALFHAGSTSHITRFPQNNTF